jgi:hypothetical protein
MGGVERIRNLSGDHQCFGRGYRSPLYPRSEGLTLDEFQHQGGYTVDVFDAVDRADVRVTERGEYPRFPHEARDTVRLGDEEARQDLDRDVASECAVARAIDLL